MASASIIAKQATPLLLSSTRTAGAPITFRQLSRVQAIATKSVLAFLETSAAMQIQDCMDIYLYTMHLWVLQEHQVHRSRVAHGYVGHPHHQVFNGLVVPSKHYPTSSQLL
jgi:hypothetical protein